MEYLAFSLLMILGGWLLRGALGGRWWDNPKQHRLADARYRLVEIGGKWHAFTEEALRAAYVRAEVLEQRFPRRWLSRLLWSILVGGLVLVFVTGCANDGRHVVDAQRPGAATGAGATFTGPTNSAAPSTQKAKRTVVYQKAPAAARNSSAARFVGPDGQEFEVIPVVRSEPAAVPASDALAPGAEFAPAPPSAPTPAWEHDEIETTFGQHQDAAGIVKVAIAASGWPAMRWVGIICVLVGLGGLLWSQGNPDGYPVVFLKVAGLGVFFIIVADNPAWLLLLILPVGFYVVQKLNLLRLP